MIIEYVKLEIAFYVKKYFQNIVSDIQRELSVLEFDLIFFTNDNLKTSLIFITRQLMPSFIDVLKNNH